MNAETALKVNRAYQEAFSFGGISPCPDLSILIDFEKLIDVNDPAKTGKQIWLWKMENNPENRILTTDYWSFGKSIIDAYDATN